MAIHYQVEWGKISDPPSPPPAWCLSCGRKVVDASVISLYNVGSYKDVAVFLASTYPIIVTVSTLLIVLVLHENE